jgi:hypothetical protein
MSVFDGVPSGATVWVRINGVLTDVTQWTTGRQLSIRRAAPRGEPSRLSIPLEKIGGGIQVVELAEVRVEDRTNPGEAYPRYFHGLLINPTYRVRSNVHAVYELACVGNDWRWHNPPEFLAGEYTIGLMVWQPGTVYAVGDQVRANPDNGHKFICTIAGTSLDDPIGPVWDLDPGDFTTDGGVQWQENGASAISDKEMIEELLPLFFGTEVDYTGISTLNASMPSITFQPDWAPQQCMEEIAKYSASGTYDPWQADFAYSPGDVIEPTPSNGFYYQALTSGISGMSPPAFNTTVGSITLESGGTGTIEWRNMGPTHVQPSWRMAIPPDDLAHTAGWKPVVSYFDLNSTIGVPTLTKEYTSGAPDATHLHYEEIAISRSADDFANRVTVRGSLGSVGVKEDPVSFGDLGIWVAKVFVNEGLQTNAECEAEANKILGILGRARETVHVRADEPLDPSMIRNVQAAFVQNDLHLNRTKYVIRNTSMELQVDGPAKWVTEFGDGLLMDGEDPLQNAAGGRRFAFDREPPSIPTWDTNPGSPNYFVLFNNWEPVPQKVRAAVQWLSGHEADLEHFLIRYKYSGDDFWRSAGPILAPRQHFVFPDLLDPGVTVQVKVLSRDTSGNPRQTTEANWSAVASFVTVNPSLPAPPTSLSYTSGHSRNGRGWIRVAFTHSAGDHGGGYNGYMRSTPSGPDHLIPGSPTQDNSILILDLPPRCTRYIRIRTIDQYGREGSESTPLTATVGYSPSRKVPESWDYPDAEDDLRGLEVLAGAESNVAFVNSALEPSHTPFEGETSLKLFGTMPLTVEVSGPEYSVEEEEEIVIGAARMRSDPEIPSAPPNAALLAAWYDRAGVIIGSPVTIWDTTPDLVFSYEEKLVKSPVGAKSLRWRLKMYGGTGAYSTFWSFPKVDRPDNSIRIGRDAITPEKQDLGLFGVVFNGDMEIPSLEGTLPEGYEASGNYEYVTSPGIPFSGNHNGVKAMLLGGVGGVMNTLISPFFLLLSAPTAVRYNMRLRWLWYGQTGITSGAVKVRFYNKAKSVVGSDASLYRNDGTVYTAANVVGPEEVHLKNTDVPAGAVYGRVVWPIQLSNTNKVMIDGLEVDHANRPQSSEIYEVRDATSLLRGTVSGTTSPAGVRISAQSASSNGLNVLDSSTAAAIQLLSGTNPLLNVPRLSSDPGTLADGDLWLLSTDSNNALQMRMRNNGVTRVPFGVGSAFPSSPITGQQFWRTDLGVLCYWDGSRWLGPEQRVDWHYYPLAPTGEIAATTEYQYASLSRDRATRLMRWEIGEGYVNGTNNGSNYWKLILRTFPAQVNVQSTPFNTSGWAGTTWTPGRVTSFDTHPAGGTNAIQVYVEMVGSPGPIRFPHALYVREIYT